MPQMSPMDWLFLMIFILFIYFLLMVFIYFLNNLNIKFRGYKVVFNKKKFFMNW